MTDAEHSLANVAGVVKAYDAVKEMVLVEFDHIEGLVELAASQLKQLSLT